MKGQSIVVYLVGSFFSIMIVMGIMWSVQEVIGRTVVIYVAHDQDYSEPILKEFEEKTGMKIKVKYDTELTKTVGLVNRLIAEKDNPRADVFWNNEVSRSIQLKNEFISKPYCSVSSINISEKYKDKECYWTGFAARARVLIYNTDLVNESEAPISIYELTDEKWKGKVCIANPLFGTTGSHIAALFAIMGDERAKEFLLNLKENEIQIVSSNSMVRDQVVAGECWIGITDTDDANDAIVDGKPVKMIFPDQNPADTARALLIKQAKDSKQMHDLYGYAGVPFISGDRILELTDEEILGYFDSFNISLPRGTLIIPNTVMLINGAPHEENGKILIDFLLSKEVEKKLSETKALQMPTRDVETPKNVPKLTELNGLSVNEYQIFEKLNASREFVQNEFVE
ncbi:MAG: iron ABC transporter substrate-binding protein [Candidatus Aenigmatarchaeota archaeon]|nr:MAG: iron ABC transporter substrate-binding protein [Candidatus Aenigmarchaeota archaeon]